MTRRSRTRNAMVRLAVGGVLPGWAQAFGTLNFASIITAVLAQVLSLLVSLLLGGDTTPTGM